MVGKEKETQLLQIQSECLSVCACMCFVILHLFVFNDMPTEARLGPMYSCRVDTASSHPDGIACRKLYNCGAGRYIKADSC